MTTRTGGPYGALREPRSGVAGLAALVAVLLTIGAGGGSGDYRVDAIFDSADFLISGQDVKVAGARVGQVTALIASSIAPAAPPSAPSIRNIVLNPSRYLDQKVTVTGQFG